MSDIRPIRTEEDYEWALAEVEQYFDSEPDLGTPESDRFEILTTLIEAYEEKRWPIEPPDPVDIIKYAIEELGHRQNGARRTAGLPLASIGDPEPQASSDDEGGLQAAHAVAPPGRSLDPALPLGTGLSPSARLPPPPPTSTPPFPHSSPPGRAPPRCG